MMPKRKWSSRLENSLAMALAATVVSGALIGAPKAHASAFQLHENTVEAMGHAYAGLATAGNDCSVVANNPAAMKLADNCFQIDATVIDFNAEFSGKAENINVGAPIYGDDNINGGDTIPVPAVYWAGDMGRWWHLGIGFTVPFGFKTEYNRNWIGRYNAIKSEFKSLDGIISLSWDVSDNLSLGVSAIAQHTSATLTSAINYHAIALGIASNSPLPPSAAHTITTAIPAGSDGIAKIEGDDWGYGWQAGVLWTWGSNRLALKYRSKIDHTLTGDATFTMPSNVKAVFTKPVVQALMSGPRGNTPFINTTGSADFTTPAVASASYWYKGEVFGIGATVAYTEWDVFNELRVNYANPTQPDTAVPYDWRNSWYAAIGADWYLGDSLTLRAGVATDTTPTRDSTRTPRVPDGDRELAAIGLGLDLTHHWQLNLAYTRIFVDTVSVDTTSSTGDRLVGTFDDSGNLMGASLEYSF